MPNLVGIWAPGMSEETVRLTVNTQLDRVRVPGIPHVVHLESGAGFGVALMDHGLLDNGPQPARSDDGKLVLMMDGEIYNGGDLKRQFRNQLPERDLSTPELCLWLIAKFGAPVVKEFNGLFALVLYERPTERLTVITDRFAFRPIFYIRRANSVIFASEIKALCVVDPEKREIDEIGTLELFTYGCHFGDRTWIDGYRRPPPATIVTIDREGIKSRSYWQYGYDETATVLDQPTYSMTFGALLERAVERCMQTKHRVGIFLSGGYDSRSVAASIRKCYLPVPAFTFGSPESRDAIYGKQLAERLGLEHYALTNSDRYLYPHCRSIVWRTEGMVPFANCTSIQFHRILKEKVDIILLGFLGEFSGSHTWPALLLARSREAAVTAVFDRFIGSRLGVVRRLFNPKFFARTFEGVQRAFEQSFEKINNDHPMNIADSWNFIHLQPRGTFHSPSVDRHLFEARAPHLDVDLVHFLLTIPPLSRLEQRVYKKMIAYKYPAIRDVPCTNSGRPINPVFASEYAAITLRYLARKAMAPFHHALGNGKSLGREFRDLGEDFRSEPELATLLRDLLRAGAFPPQIFDHAAIEELIREHYELKRQHEATLSLLLSYGLAVKYFFMDALSDAPHEMYVSEV
jgi:asparagine synthase (glutamine-hydrolysing)